MVFFFGRSENKGKRKGKGLPNKKLSFYFLLGRGGLGVHTDRKNLILLEIWTMEVLIS